MAYIFLDESGDLGFKSKSSKWFVFTAICTKSYRKIEKVLKKIRRGLKRKQRKVKELHAYHSDAKTRKRLLKKLTELQDLKIYCVVLDKKKIPTILRDQKNYIYNYAANRLLDQLSGKKADTRELLKVFIDQKDTNKNSKNNLEVFLKSGFRRDRDIEVEIKIKTSHSEKCLQAVDFVSWAIFRKYELNDSEYYEIIKDRIIGEKLLSIQK